MRPKGDRQRRSIWHVGMRAAAVKAVATAMPNMRVCEISAALGMSRYQVRRYLADINKCAGSDTPAWSGRLYEACRLLHEGLPHSAAEQFMNLSRELLQQPGVDGKTTNAA